MTSWASWPEVQNAVVMACRSGFMDLAMGARVGTEDRVEGDGEEAVVGDEDGAVDGESDGKGEEIGGLDRVLDCESCGGEDAEEDEGDGEGICAKLALRSGYCSDPIASGWLERTLVTGRCS